MPMAPKPWGTSQLGELQNGVQSLNEALVKLQSGSSQLYDGSKTLESGLSDAKTGSSQLSEGIHTAQSSVTESIDSTKEKLKATDGLADFTAHSVVTEAKPYDSVENYGSAFAPYFLCVSLWTGGLTMMLSVYLDQNKRMESVPPTLIAVFYGWEFSLVSVWHKPCWLAWWFIWDLVCKLIMYLVFTQDCC